jgi:hypothetical protein
MATPVYEGTNPLVSDRYIITATAGEDLTMGEVVEISADWTVAKPTTNPSLKFCGICLTSALSGKKVSVILRGLARAIAYGTITAGDRLGTARYGRVATIADAADADLISSAGIALAINNSRKILGRAIYGAASGGTAYILLT